MKKIVVTTRLTRRVSCMLDGTRVSSQLSAVDRVLESDDLKSLICDYRATCLWSMAADFMPRNQRQLLLVLDRIERYGDMAALRRLEEVRKWL